MLPHEIMDFLPPCAADTALQPPTFARAQRLPGFASQAASACAPAVDSRGLHLVAGPGRRSVANAHIDLSAPCASCASVGAGYACKFKFQLGQHSIATTERYLRG